MTDTDYINELVSAYKELDSLLAHFKVLITDPNGATLFASKLYKMSCGVEDIPIGMKYTQQEQTGKYLAQDTLNEWQEVVAKQTPKHSINVNMIDGKIQPYMTSKFPIINPDTNNVVGIFNIRHQVLYNSIQHQLMRALDIYKISDKAAISEYELTKREKQLIFLFLSGLSSKEIAMILSKIEDKEISKNTIDNIFANQIRVKFNAYSREALTEKLLQLGFDQLIPQDLLMSFKIPLLDVETY